MSLRHLNWAGGGYQRIFEPQHLSILFGLAENEHGVLDAVLIQTIGSNNFGIGIDLGWREEDEEDGDHLLSDYLVDIDDSKSLGPDYNTVFTQATAGGVGFQTSTMLPIGVPIMHDLVFEKNTRDSYQLTLYYHKEVGGMHWDKIDDLAEIRRINREISPGAPFYRPTSQILVVEKQGVIPSD